MKYEIWGDKLPAVTFTLDRGESIFTQSGGMSWMSGGIEMETNMRGGLLKGIGRLFSGENLFLVNYKALESDQSITFSSSFPGDLLKFDIHSGRSVIAQKGAFLCATEGINVSAAFTSARSGLFGGEGFILQEYAGDGIVFCELDGAVKEYTLSQNETIRVSSGNVAAFESGVSYDITTVKGLKNIVFGGEGLFLTTLTGPGKVWLQTMSAGKLAGKIIPHIPKSGD